MPDPHVVISKPVFCENLTDCISIGLLGIIGVIINEEKYVIKAEFPNLISK
jgi:hypothetical protein